MKKTETREKFSAALEAYAKVKKGTYLEGIGTVRACINCGALISGGPTRCVYCVDRLYPKTRWKRFKKRVRWLFGSVVGWG